MLAIDIPSIVYEVPGSWNGKTKKLITVPPIHLEFEHSLNSIAEWESKWKIPFLEHPAMTTEEFLDYCRCMTLNKPQNPDVYNYIRQSDVKKITEYIADNMSARRLRDRRNRNRGSRVVMTSEYFYFLMIEFGIPFNPCAGWHFNRLMALIDCCQSNSGSGGDKMSYRERQKWYAELNGQRRKALGSKG